MEELTLFEMTNSYDISHLKEICRTEIKKKFPKALDEEEFSEYIEFIEDEVNLLYATRLREIADEIEKKVLEPQKQDIQRIYKNEHI